MRQEAREAHEAAAAEQRRIDAEAAFVEQQAEHVSDDKTTGTATIIASECTQNGPDGTPTGGLKRTMENNPSVKSFVETDADATAALADAPPPPAKKLKLSFKMKKPGA